jgi:hypothetical protein
MMIIGCDFHTRYQQIAMVDEATGELVERRLDHESGEAHTFYRGLPKPVRVGIEATGPLQWFERRRGGSFPLALARFPGFTFNCKLSTLNRILPSTGS